ncbi:hypothetical protein JCM3774_005827 [Rhodotorula dairenensis]
MLDDPFVPVQQQQQQQQQQSRAAYFGHASAPYSLLLSGHASKFKSSTTTGPSTVARPFGGVGGLGKENGLLPSPRFGASVSSSSSSSSSSTAPSSSSSPPREGETRSGRLVRRRSKSVLSKPALKRRVTFSPTPLASLQSSPSHAKRARPTSTTTSSSMTTGLLFAHECGYDGERERDAKRTRRDNVYSDNPLLEAARLARPSAGREDDAESGSDVRPGGDSSPVGLASPKVLPLLPRSPPRPRTKSASNSGGSLGGSYPTSFAPFSGVFAPLQSGLEVTTRREETAAGPEAAEATDSEEESEQVESLLLPASVSPKKPAAKQPSSDPALVLPPKHHLLSLSATFPSRVVEASTSSSCSSSSPLRSPSATRSRANRPAPSLLSPPGPPLRSILKQKAASGNFIVKDEREGLRKNGRGRRHVVGWDGEKKLKVARERRVDEQATKAKAAVPARDAQDADAADGAGAGASRDKGKGKAKEAGSTTNTSASRASSTSARTTRSSARTARSAGARLGNGGERREDDEDEPPRRRRGVGPLGGPATSTTTTTTASNTNANATRSAPPQPPPPPSPSRGKRDPTRIKHELQLDDPVQLRTPLLVLRASLEAAASRSSDAAGAAAAAGGPGLSAVGNGLGPSLLPRPLAAAPALGPLQEQQQIAGPTIANLLTLHDVENAYVSLKNAVFCLPSVLADAEASLEPLRTHGSALLGALTRDVENIKTFPRWVVEQPRPVPEPEELVVEADAADEPSSSPSLYRRAVAAPPPLAPGAKTSLTATQMTRMRDELGTAQAAVKCAAACLRDARVVALFPPTGLAKLVETVMSVAVAPDLSISVRRDLFPFLPFFLSSVAAPTAAVLRDLVVPTLLPSLRVTLTLDPRVDRFRQSLSESLDALAVLLPLHGQQMLDSHAWRIWLREATMGLWDGTKKMVSTHDKAVKVLGRVIRILTVPVQTLAWSVERESVHADISRDLHALFTATPPGAELDPTDDKKQRRMTYLQTLLAQCAQSSGKAAAATNEIATLSVLALLPPLLGAEFRLIHPRGIAPWVTAFSSLSASSSTPVLVLSALAWPHLAFAFLRTPGQDGTPWMFRPTRSGGERSKSLSAYLAIFESRAIRWQREVDASVNEERKVQIGLHAKALALAFVGVVYGSTVYVRHGTTSVRPADGSGSTAVPPARSPMYDRVFNEILEVYLPSITTSEASSECNVIGWQILARICRPKSANERSALLESLINPIFLDGTLAVIPPDSSKMKVLIDAALQRCVKPAAIPGWSEQWLSDNVERVLALFEKCLGRDAEGALIAQQEVLNTWRNLLRTIAGQPRALSRAVGWLTSFGLAHGDLAASLWTILLARGSEQQINVVQAAMLSDTRALHLATTSWLAGADKRPEYADVLANVASRRLATLPAGANARLEIETAFLLLRVLAKLETPDQLGTDRFGLAEAIIRLVWSSDAGSVTLQEHVCGTLMKPDEAASTNLRLCAKLVAGSQRVDANVRQEVLSSCGAVALSALASYTPPENVELIANMLQLACDTTYPELYEAVLKRLQSAVDPTKATFERFSPLLVDPLRRAIALAISAADADTQSLLQASLHLHEPAAAHLQLIQSFDSFWKETFAPLEHEVDLPHDLSDLLQIVRGIVHSSDTASWEPSLGGTIESMPVPAQVAAAVTDNYRTTVSEDRILSSRAGYEADVSCLPPLQGPATTSGILPDAGAARRSHGKVISPSLRAPTGEQAAAVVAVAAHEADDDTQMIDETQSDVLTREANASFAAMSNRVLSQETSDSAMIGHDTTGLVSKVPHHRKRLRATGSGSDFASSAEDSTSETSSGRRRVGKRRRNKSAESQEMIGTSRRAAAAAVTLPSPVHDSQCGPEGTQDHADLASHHDQATEDIVRSFLSLPIDTVVSVGKRIGGSPSLRRLIDLGERAREYFERMNSASP